MRETAWRIDFTEMERGWGSRPMGYTLYASEELARLAYTAHWAEYGEEAVPEYYIHASEPRFVQLTVQEAKVMGDLNSCPFG